MRTARMSGVRSADGKEMCAHPDGPAQFRQGGGEGIYTNPLPHRPLPFLGTSRNERFPRKGMAWEGAFKQHLCVFNKCAILISSKTMYGLWSLFFLMHGTSENHSFIHSNFPEGGIRQKSSI
jgi:hypothetical protein